MSTPSPYIVGRIPKLPPKYALIVMPLLMSGMMSGIICMVNLVRALGWSRAALAAWPGTWLLACGTCQDSCRVIYAARRIFCVMLSILSGFKATASMGCQFLV